ncbi:hypothetical protein LHK63_18605, partial [Escherichia coli]|uniref:hypothetical protein n=1 Tax=Escherichia coli TaxID=562 RepID=UPI001CFB88EA
CSPMTSLKTSIKTITYLSDIGCLEIQGASLPTITLFLVLTVPRALSRIHRITKFTLKRAAEQSRSKTDTAKRHQKIDNRGRCSGVVT